MARRASAESTSDLYIRLGLSLDELESGFVDAQRTIRDNMSRLYRENMIIDLQARVELEGLDELADAERILEIRTNALNQQIKNQKDRVRLAAAELRNMEERTGAASDQSQRARIALEHHRLALARMEEQLAHLNDTQDDTADNSFSLLDAFDKFAQQCWNIIGIVQVVGDAFTGLISNFEELQKQAYELNMPVNDVENFLRHMKLAGGDIGDFEGFIRGITDAYTKGEFDDPEFLALDKYGAKITDATGRLKDFAAITEEVYQAYQKAKAVGEEIEFLQLVGGESGVRDAIQYFERYEEAKADAEKIFDAGIDPDELHEADRALNLLTAQLGEFKDAIVNLGIQRATSAFKTLFEVIRSGTEVIVNFNESLNEAKTREPTISAAPVTNSYLTGGFDVEAFQKDMDEVGKTLPKVTASWADFKKEIDTHDLDDNPLSQYALKRIKDFRDELTELRIELDYADNDYEQAKAKLDLWKKNELTDKLFVSSDERIAIEELYSAKLEQIEKDRADKEEEFQKAIDAIKQNALEKALAKIDKEKEAWTQKGIDEVKATEWAEQAKAEAIKKESQKLGTKKDEFEEKLRKYYENIDKQDTEYAKKLQAQQDQYRKAVEQRKQQAESLYSKLAALRHDDLTTALAAIEKEKQAWIQKGISEVSATEWAEQAKANAQRNAAMSVLKSQIQELRLFQKEGYTGLQKYYMQQFLKETGLKNYELQTLTPEIIKAFKQASDMAQRTLLPRFMTDWERNVNNKIMTYGSADLGNLERYDSKIGYLLPKYPAPPNSPTPPDKPTAPEGLYDDLQKLQEIVQSMGLPVEKINEQLEQINMPVDKLNEQLSHLNVSTTEKTDDAVKDSAKSITSSFEALTELIQQNLTPCLDGFAKQLANATEVSAALQNDMNNLHGSIGELVAYLESLALRAGQGGGGGGGNSGGPTSAPGDQGATNNITNTININEAHAWDSEHIQDLAEKVASVITPQITNAIGGDDNAY